MLYNVHTLDVWGNENDGYDVNDVYPSVGCVELEESYTDHDIFVALHNADIVNNVNPGKLDITGEHGYTLYIGYAGKPIFELRPVDDNNSSCQT